jgi:prolyl oligopeptidase
MREVLRAYSPFHQLKPHKDFPDFLLMTSSKDDRVHPAHARKMAAKMKDYGLDYLYYENTEGGHAASADYKQTARKYAMIYSFLWDRLNPNSANSN